MAAANHLLSAATQQQQTTNGIVLIGGVRAQTSIRRCHGERNERDDTRRSRLTLRDDPAMPWCRWSATGFHRQVDRADTRRPSSGKRVPISPIPVTVPQIGTSTSYYRGRSRVGIADTGRADRHRTSLSQCGSIRGATCASVRPSRPSAVGELAGEAADATVSGVDGTRAAPRRVDRNSALPPQCVDVGTCLHRRGAERCGFSQSSSSLLDTAMLPPRQGRGPTRTATGVGHPGLLRRGTLVVRHGGERQRK